MSEISALLPPSRLSEILRSSGALKSGEVIGVEPGAAISNRGLVSEVARLNVTYSPDATGDMPKALFMKASREDTHPELRDAARHEAEFYRLAAQLSDLPIPRCYAAEADAGNGRSLLITEDLSDTHYSRALPIPPSNQECELIIDALARLHARLWGDAGLGVELGTRMTSDRARQEADRLVQTLPAFYDFLGDTLLPEQRRVYEGIVSSSFLRSSFDRHIRLAGVTLIHGDVHTGNIMLPRNPACDDVKLIDWQLWGVGVAALDLAFLMLHWSTERRAALERPLLERYHTALLSHGVGGYTWQDCYDDYRRAVITMVLVPIGQFRRGLPSGVIWFGLQDATAAFRDLRCAELLEA